MPKRFHEVSKKNPTGDEVDYSDLPTVPAAPLHTSGHIPVGKDFWQSSEENASVTIDYAAARRRPTRPPDYNLEEHYEAPTAPREMANPYQGPAHFAPAPLDGFGPTTAPIDLDERERSSLWDADNRTPSPVRATPTQSPPSVPEQPEPAPPQRTPSLATSQRPPALPHPPPPGASQAPPRHISQRIAALKRERAAAMAQHQAPPRQPASDVFEADPYEYAAIQRSTLGIIVGLGLVLMMFAALLLLVVLAFAGEDIARFLGLIG